MGFELHTEKYTETFNFFSIITLCVSLCIRFLAVEIWTFFQSTNFGIVFLQLMWTSFYFPYVLVLNPYITHTHREFF